MNTKLPINSKSLLLSIIGLPESDLSGELGGITRLQKLVFLLEREYGIQASEDQEFVPYKAGPYSAKLYDDLEFLENLGYLKSEIVGEMTHEEALEIDALNFEDFVSSNSDERIGSADAYLERSFQLTERGKSKVKELLNKPDYRPLVEGIKKVKSKYGKYSLSDLLYYVYSKYPEMTTESEIKNKVLSSKSKGWLV